MVKWGINETETGGKAVKQSVGMDKQSESYISSPAGNSDDLGNDCTRSGNGILF